MEQRNKLIDEARARISRVISILESGDLSGAVDAFDDVKEATYEYLRYDAAGPSDDEGQADPNTAKQCVHMPRNGMMREARISRLESDTTHV